MKRVLYIFSFFFLMHIFPAAAQPAVQADLISEKEGISAAGEIYIALQLTLPDGWHVYWKNSGDSGEATDLLLTLPEGFREIERLWPVPERFKVGTMAEYGYKNQAFLVVKIKAPENLKPKQKLEISGKATWLACKDECVPSSADVSLFLTSGLKSPENQKFKDILESVPENRTEPVSMWETKDEIIFEIPSSPLVKSAYFFPDTDKMILQSAEQSVREKGGSIYVFVPAMPEKEAALSGKISGTLVLYDKDGAKTESFNMTAEQTTKPLPVFSEAVLFSDFIWALVLAFSGGFLLNLMPCVFPVLFLKAFSILSSKSVPSKAALRQEGTAYTAGVLLSFAVIGSVLIGLRAVGTELGWGFQLQYPPFVFLLSLFIFFLGLVFSGVICVGTNLVCLGAGCLNRKWGNFGTGILAVFIATPCAAPFMGAALGYGLTSPAPVTMTVFMMMGLGMSLPFLLLGLFPALSRFLPKPGEWMNTFRQFLAFPLYATAGWLMWVLAAQSGSLALAAGLTGFVAVAFVSWLYTLSECRPRLVFYARTAVLCFLLFVGSAAYKLAPAVQQEMSATQIEWIPYSGEMVHSYRKQGVPVFLKFSASWCLTCLVNDNVAFSSGEIARLFKEKGVVPFFADWTTRNDKITAALEEYGRGGIPLYVYYAPFSEKPVILPQMITEGMVADLVKGL